MRAALLFIIFAICFLIGMQLSATKCRAESMVASYYGAESGTRTASGAAFRPEGMTAAHRTLPFGTVLRVCLSGRCTQVTINDRGPAAWTRRSLDLSAGAARVIGLVGRGVARVEVERL